MSYQCIQDEVEKVFDASISPYIVHEDEQLKPLTKILPPPVTVEQSIDIIGDVIKGIIYMREKLLVYRPCQVFKEHIVKNNKNWALKNVICYRYKNEQNYEKSLIKYHADEFEYHKDEENELVWSIGNLWFELLTNKRIPLLSDVIQEQIQDEIQENIINKTMVNLLNKILVKDKNIRLSFEDLITDEIFSFTHSEYESSMIKYISKINVIPKPKKQRQVPFTIFEEKVFQRDIKESLSICSLFERVKKKIKETFSIDDDTTQIDFSLYLMDAKLYFRMKALETLRQEKQYHVQDLEDKESYSQFMRKFLILFDSLNRKRKIKKFKKYQAIFPQIFSEPDNMDQDKIHVQFKSYMVAYAKYLLPQKENKEFHAFYICILLVRCSDYVFSNARDYVFKEFIDAKWNLKQILNNIYLCQQKEKLKKLEKKLMDFYFHS